jgi:hypothetical protein
MNPSTPIPDEPPRKQPGTRTLLGPLTVSHSVIVEMVRRGRARGPGSAQGRPRPGGPLARLAGLAGESSDWRRQGKSVRVWIVADRATPLSPLAAQVRQAVGATVVRLLGLELGEVTVVSMASGAGDRDPDRGDAGRSPAARRDTADEVNSHRLGRRLALAALFEAEFGQRTAPTILERHLAEADADEATATFARGW